MTMLSVIEEIWKKSHREIIIEFYSDELTCVFLCSIWMLKKIVRRTMFFISVTVPSFLKLLAQIVN